MSGINNLSSLLRSQMHEVSKYNIGSGNIVFGTITSGNGLKPDGLDYTIPRSDYLVCRSCSGSLAVGHRVLVGIFKNEFVVIDILV